MAQDDNEIVGFSPNDARRLLEEIGIGEEPVKIHSRPHQTNRVIHAKTPAGGIAGRAALQMSYSSCDLYDCSQAGLLSDSGTNYDIWNPATAAVAALTHIVAAKNTAGLWVVILEDCP